MQKLKPWLITVAHVAAGVILFESASVQAYIAAHPANSGTLAMVWALVMHWAQSPFKK